MRNTLLFCLLFLFLSACVPILSVDSRLDLRSGENWELQFKIKTPPDSGAYAGLLSEALNETVTQLQAEKIAATWELQGSDQEGNQVYVVKAEGQGYDKLNEGLFSDEIITIQDSSSGRQIHFQIYNFSDFDELALESKFTLHGGKILSTNGTKINSSTVEWINPQGPMEAILTESSGSSWISILLILLILGAGGIVAWIFLRKSRHPFTPAYQPGYDSTTTTLGVRYCANCGSQMPPQAMFCPQCGAQRQ